MSSEHGSRPGASPTLTKALLARYRAGDYAAEERLFERFRTALIKRTRSHPRMRPLQRECAPEDAVQEVFLRALASGMLHRFEDHGRGSLQAALFAVLDNTLVDMARRLNTLKRGADSIRLQSSTPDAASLVDQMAADDTTPTSHARSAELIEVARSVLLPREFDVWLRSELQGYNSAELAHDMHTTSAAVRGILFRAQRKLMRALEHSDHFRRS